MGSERKPKLISDKIRSTHGTKSQIKWRSLFERICSMWLWNFPQQTAEEVSFTVIECKCPLHSWSLTLVYEDKLQLCQDTPSYQDSHWNCSLVGTMPPSTPFSLSESRTITCCVNPQLIRRSACCWSDGFMFWLSRKEQLFHFAFVEQQRRDCSFPDKINLLDQWSTCAVNIRF